jgi:hypothetical protein
MRKVSSCVGRFGPAAPLAFVVELEKLLNVQLLPKQSLRVVELLAEYEARVSDPTFDSACWCFTCELAKVVDVVFSAEVLVEVESLHRAYCELRFQQLGVRFSKDRVVKDGGC